MTIDFSRPVQTRDGRTVRILCTDAPGRYPIVGIVDGENAPSTWQVDGKYDPLGGSDHYDLINAPQDWVWYVPIKLCGEAILAGFSYESAADAKRREQCNAILRLTARDGRLVSAEIVEGDQ